MKLSKYITTLTIFVHQILRGGGGGSLSLPTYLQYQVSTVSSPKNLTFMSSAQHFQFGLKLLLFVSSEGFVSTHPAPT